ncbi:MAG: hypothetical protein A2W35_10120 [Chloroflexi bacterium RBG_16_57_11]|nr:MAG: hypothetical protein A2W35_10120 [Chloroflexi bacterium RBG_16_57_11]
MQLSPIFDVAGPGLVIGLLAFGVVFIFLLFLLIVLVEMVALQLLRWGDFKASLKAAVWMNLASTLLGLVLLWLVPALGLLGIAIAWALSVLIEWLVLMRLHPGENRRNLMLAAVANLASYGLLIVPSYLLSS